jgi:DNA-binding MarR family transcriptional regulator
VAAADLAPRLGLAVVRLARVLRQQDEGELTPTMRSALATIDREGPLTLGDLAAAEHVAPPTVTKVVGKLEDRGLVTRTTGADDRRVSRVATTAAGTALLAADRRRRATWLADRLAGLDDDERAAVVTALPVLERLTGVDVRR